jgi:CheY-like chemotaxis protein
VENGREALDALARRPFDLVLMDVEMPEMDGLEATATLRQRELDAGGGHVPIIAMTAHAVHGFRQRCIEAGMDAFVSKPIQPTELFRTIDGLVAAVPESRTENLPEQSAP